MKKGKKLVLYFNKPLAVIVQCFYVLSYRNQILKHPVSAYIFFPKTRFRKYRCVDVNRFKYFVTLIVQDERSIFISLTDKCVA